MFSEEDFLYDQTLEAGLGLHHLILFGGHFEICLPNKMAAEGFQYLALYPFTKDQEEDLDLQPGDLLTVSKASLLSMENYKEGCVEHPEHLGWLLGYNERTKQRGDFPGTYVKYMGPIKMVLPLSQPRSQRPLPAAPRLDSSQGNTFFAYSLLSHVTIANFKLTLRYRVAINAEMIIQLID